MKWPRKIVSSSHFVSLFIVVIFAILAARTLIFQSGYFNMHDDLQMMRQLQMEKCFKDGQIPCRWVPDMGYGYGFPLFNFYPPLPYLIGQGIRLIGFSFINTVKLNFALSIVVSGVGMYLLAKEFFPPTLKLRRISISLGAIISAVFYIWAPYHAVDVYVRGAMNEAWALAFLPLIFWAGYKLVISDKKSRKASQRGRQVTNWIIGLSLAWFALFTSHNLMVLIFIPIFIFWVLIHLWRKNAWSRLPSLLISGILSLGLAAFFTLPALAENKFTQIKGQLVGYYDYTAHFVSLRQLLITRFWGYGPSVWVEAEDRMSFQIGHVHWILSLAIGGFLAYRIAKIKGNKLDAFKKDSLLLVTTYLFLVGWFSAFMTHLRSIIIYKTISILGYIQFPWRFLTIVIFAFSFIAGAFVLIIKDSKLKLLLSGVLVASLLFLNWKYFLPEHGKMGALTDKEKFSGAAWDLQQTAGIYDYLPAGAKMAPTSPQVMLAEILEGVGVISNEKQGTNWAEFSVNIESEEALIRLGVFQFPGWKTYVDGIEVKSFVSEDESWGRIYLSVPKFEHIVRAEFTNTPIRTAGNLISLFSWGGLFAFLISKANYKKD